MNKKKEIKNFIKEFKNKKEELTSKVKIGANNTKEFSKEVKKEISNNIKPIVKNIKIKTKETIKELNIPISLFLDKEVNEWIKNESKIKGLTKSKIINMIIKKEIQSNKK